MKKTWLYNEDERADHILHMMKSNGWLAFCEELQVRMETCKMTGLATYVDVETYHYNAGRYMSMEDIIVRLKTDLQRRIAKAEGGEKTAET